MLRTILRPLKAVEEQALAICNREFPVQQHIPRTRELRRVVLAMNSMSEKLHGFIQELSERAEQMRREAHEDALTGLRNRRAFNAMLESILRDREQGVTGSLVIVRMSEFAVYNKQHGVQAGNELLIDIAKQLNKIMALYPTSEVFRMSGTDFSMLLPKTDQGIADEVGKSLSDMLNSLALTLNTDEVAHIGIALFQDDYQTGEILADADAGLALARHIGVNSYAIQSKKSEALGNDAWKVLIESTLSNQNIQLLGQPVLNISGETLYKEVFIRMRDKFGENISPGVFVSMADRLDLNQPLDKLIIEKVTGLINERSGELDILAINLSAYSVSDPSFHDWLAQHFDNHPDLGKKLIFEVSEQGLIHNIERANEFIHLIHTKGSQIVMEHFGTRLSSFQILHQLKVDFIKISGSYTRDVENHEENRFFLQTVADIAHGLEIEMIAEQVETEAEAKVMEALGIEVMQGYYFGSPEAFEK